MNYVGEYKEVVSKSGIRGIFCELLTENDSSFQIIVGENEQIARRIIYMVHSGLNRNESLEENLPGINNLFNKNDYFITIEKDSFYETDEEIFVHKDFK